MDEEFIIKEFGEEGLQTVHLLQGDAPHFCVVHVFVKLVVVVLGGQHDGGNQQSKITIYILMHAVLV